MRASLLVPVCLLVTSPVAAADAVDYARDVKPLLARHCVGCHGPQKQRSGLRLDTGAAALKGGNTGPAVVPGKSAASILIKAVTGSDDNVSKMPPQGAPLTDKEVAVLKAWIDAGAPVPPGEKAVAAQVTSRHWAFAPPKRHDQPPVKNAAWVRNPVDAFILARLEKDGTRPAPEADRATLIRRVSFDLLGLPPDPREVEAFVRDQRPDAYERLVDRLLDSPHYGERMARLWLDQARYADSNGFTIDGPRPIWKYRDWVIQAFTNDTPFDRFTVEQLAGDLLPNATRDQKVATGFHRNTSRNEEGGIDLEQFRVESVVDRVNTTGTVWLGLTVGCCQCHDHKYDPLTQREYYQLFAFLNNADEPTLELATPEQVKKRNSIRTRLNNLEKRRKAIDFTTSAKEESWERSLTVEQRATLPPDIQVIVALPENGRSPEQKQTLTTAFRKIDMTGHLVAALGVRDPVAAAAQAEAVRFRLFVEEESARLKKEEPEVVSTLVMQERPTPRVTNLMIQGDFTRPGVVVQPGVPAVLHGLPAKEKVNRLDLARWLVDPANPLTPRVTVNRYWQHFFGLGLVETDNDFGTQGTPPSHPELLDWLATEFIARQWSVKALHKLLVTSATYRQSSKARPELATLDPRNRLLARQNRLRLDAEVVRDVALAASGLLSPRVGGPSVFPPQPEGVYAFTQVNKNWKADSGPNRYRRGLYTYFWRSAPHPGLTVFDAPDATGACTRRNRSNTPLQALTLLNDRAYFEFAQALATRVLREAPASDPDRVAHAFRLCLARPPRPVEGERVAQLLQRLRQDGEADAGAWLTVCRVLLNLDEFITRE